MAVVAEIPSYTSKESLKHLVVQHLGPDFAVGKVFTLRELGLDGFPVNVTGKIMKIELRRAVETCLSA